MAELLHSCPTVPKRAPMISPHLVVRITSEAIDGGCTYDVVCRKNAGTASQFASPPLVADGIDNPDQVALRKRELVVRLAAEVVKRSSMRREIPLGGGRRPRRGVLVARAAGWGVVALRVGEGGGFGEGTL